VAVHGLGASGRSPLISDAPSAPPDSIRDVEANCDGFESRFTSAMKALVAQDWAPAVAGFKKAAELNPQDPRPFRRLGSVYLATRNATEAKIAWNRALELGETLTFPMCRERLLGCEDGELALSSQGISLTNKDSKRSVFSAKRANVVSATAERRSIDSAAPYHRLKLRVGRDNYDLIYLPSYDVFSGRNITCRSFNNSRYVSCEEPGLTQQRIVAEYLAEAFRK
jgi:hypothetical protein